MKHKLKQIIASFHEKIESIQYKASLALTGALRVISKENICQELGLEPHFKSANDTESFVSFIRSTKTSLLLRYMI